MTTVEEVENEGAKILIIDDDSNGARLLSTLLSVEGFQPFEPRDWSNPIKEIEESHPDIAIVDVRLRDKSGFDLLDQIRDHPDPGVAHTTVIMMSAEDYRKQSIKAGADGFLAKPFDVPALLDIIQTTEGG